MSETLMKFHPRAGYIYMPDARLRMPGQHGGYLVRANADGFRSEREFVKERNPSTFRVLLFGDSQSAADGVSNSARYSDLVEKSTPGLEIFNYAVSGHGPDQQLLVLEDQADVERDLVVMGLYVENIRRVTSRLFKSKNSHGEVTYRPKPYFVIENGSLTPRNLPVSKASWTDETLPDEFREHVYAHGQMDRVFDKLKEAFRQAPLDARLRRGIKTAAMRFQRFQPVPQYDSLDDPAWLLLRTILERFIERSQAPVVLMLIPHYFFLSQGSDPTAYQTRYRELAAATGCHIFDPLPELLERSDKERGELWSDAEGHLSRRGHEVLAELLRPWIGRFMSQRDVAPGPPPPAASSS